MKLKICLSWTFLLIGTALSFNWADVGGVPGGQYILSPLNVSSGTVRHLNVSTISFSNGGAISVYGTDLVIERLAGDYSNIELTPNNVQFNGNTRISDNGFTL